MGWDGMAWDGMWLPLRWGVVVWYTWTCVDVQSRIIYIILVALGDTSTNEYDDDGWSQSLLTLGDVCCG